MRELNTLVNLLGDNRPALPAIERPSVPWTEWTESNVDGHSNATEPFSSFKTGGTSHLPRPSFTSQTRMYSLRLADSIIRYCTADIPDPPALSFVRDLSLLDKMWDDRDPQWNNSSPLRICGRSIALVHWPIVYRYRGNTQWKGIKQRWFEWKVRFCLMQMCQVFKSNYRPLSRNIGR
jgi:hypothetical protein